MAEDESDPIKATYEVFIKPHISEDRQVYILQYPNRDSKVNYSAKENAQPSLMKLKEDAGMVEIDVPLDAWRNYDRERGHKWGKSIQKSNQTKAGGSHGLPGGFGIGGQAAAVRGRRTAEDEEPDENVLTKDYALAVQRGEILTKQTLGGQFVSDESLTPRYMIGAFRKNQLHLTPVDQVVQMRPQFHHIDARAEQDRASRAREPGAPTQSQQAKAIHMTVKSKVDGEENSIDTMADRIAAAQQEKWKLHKYVDEDEEAAWQFYNDNLIIGADENMVDTSELTGNMPALKSALTDMEYMDTVSAPTDPAKLSRSKKVKKGTDAKGKGKEVLDENGVVVDEDAILSDLADTDDEVVKVPIAKR